MKKVKILWTGGWDSTFRIVELSRMKVVIEPVYVIDHNRSSTKYEEKAMDNIISALKNKKETKAQFLEIHKIKLDEIKPDKEISAAYNVIKKETGLGSQHEWLAWLGKNMPELEMGTEYGDPKTSHIINAIQKFGDLKFKDGIGYLNKKSSSKEGLLVLGWFKFPIIQKTEQDMLKIIKEWKYEDVMQNIWFCHTPIKGKECGLCHPCDVKMESNMEWLLPEKAKKRYYKHQRVNSIFGKKIGKVYSKLYRIIGNI